MYCLSSLLSLHYVTIEIFPFGFRKYFFSLHKSFKKHVLQFVLEFDVPELICPEENALGGGRVCACVHVCAGLCVYLFAIAGLEPPCCRTVCISCHPFCLGGRFFEGFPYVLIFTEPFLPFSVPSFCDLWQVVLRRLKVTFLFGSLETSFLTLCPVKSQLISVR